MEHLEENELASSLFAFLCQTLELLLLQEEGDVF